MAPRRRKSDFDQTIEALARQPWQACLVLAAIAWFGFHQLALIGPPASRNVNEVGGAAVIMIFRTTGMFLQYLAPLTFVLAALVSWLGRRRRAKLLAETESRSATAPLQQLSWREFEQLVGAYFERLGYTINFTPEGSDGGVDVLARKGSEIFLIQCKRWRSTQVGVSVVRELFGVMAARGATGSYVISIGSFSNDAKAFAEGRNIELIDANTLLRSDWSKVPAAAAMSFGPVSVRPAEPSCPKCGSSMVRRVAGHGINKGKPFYGCTTFPACRATAPIQN